MRRIPVTESSAESDKPVQHSEAAKPKSRPSGAEVQPASPDQECRGNVIAVQRVILTYVMTHKGPPASMTEFVTAAKALKVKVPLMVPSTARPVPNAVIYSFDGAHYMLQATQTTGRRYKALGKTFEIRVP